MKRIVSVVLLLILCFSLSACGTKEASSETESIRILISVFSDLTDISNQLDDEYLKFSSMKSIDKRLDGCLEDIHSTDFYKSLDTVSEKYNNAYKLYENVQKKYEKRYKELEKKENEVIEANEKSNSKINKNKSKSSSK